MFGACCCWVVGGSLASGCQGKGKESGGMLSPKDVRSLTLLVTRSYAMENSYDDVEKFG